MCEACETMPAVKFSFTDVAYALLEIPYYFGEGITKCTEVLQNAIAMHSKYRTENETFLREANRELNMLTDNRQGASGAQ